MRPPWKKGEVDLVDVAILGAGLYLAWIWFHKGPPGFAAGIHVFDAGQGGKGGPLALAPGDLDRAFNFRELLPGGMRGAVGTQKLRSAAPLVLAGPNAKGYGIEPADAAAAAAVQAYAAAKASGALALMA